MLERISIKNYAIIDELSIDFYKGFSVLTGETGAGKSILIGSLGLLLGGRSDASMIRFGAESLTIEGEFTITNKKTKDLLLEQNIDDPSHIIIRREISQNGKNRIFINGNQETLTKLEKIGIHLADLHGQHDHQLLLNKKVHQELLDSFSGLINEQKKFSEYYYQTLKKIEAKEKLEQKSDSLKKEINFYTDAYLEIVNANLTNNEDQHLESELTQMTHQEKIVEALHKAHDNIYISDINAVLILENTHKILESIGSFSEKYEELSFLISDALTKTKECAHLLSSYVENIVFDNNAIDMILERLSLIKELKRKYQKNSIEELNTFARECKILIEEVENIEDTIINSSKECEQSIEALGIEALKLSQLRKKGAADLSSKMEKELEFLGIVSAKFDVKISWIKDDKSFLCIKNNHIKVSEKGIDFVEFMMSSNIGEEKKPLAKIASGGEISRIMLALKSILSENDPTEISIFDEIDSGIGGMIAHNVGSNMQKIAKTRQIICITHLAQIASKSDYHYLVRKNNNNDRTFTNIVLLSSEEQVIEISRMLGGKGEYSKSLAKQMLYEPEKLNL